MESASHQGDQMANTNMLLIHSDVPATGAVSPLLHNMAKSVLEYLCF